MDPSPLVNGAVGHDDGDLDPPVLTRDIEGPTILGIFNQMD